MELFLLVVKWLATTAYDEKKVPKWEPPAEESIPYRAPSKELMEAMIKIKSTNKNDNVLTW
jgi:hypothetical protein